jgi:hypothetical protein
MYWCRNGESVAMSRPNNTRVSLVGEIREGIIRKRRDKDERMKMAARNRDRRASIAREVRAKTLMTQLQRDRLQAWEQGPAAADAGCQPEQDSPNLKRLQKNAGQRKNKKRLGNGRSAITKLTKLPIGLDDNTKSLFLKRAADEKKKKQSCVDLRKRLRSYILQLGAEQVFAMFEADHSSGSLDKADLKSGLMRLGVQVFLSDLDALWSELKSASSDNTVSVDDLKNFITTPEPGNPAEQYYLQLEQHKKVKQLAKQHTERKVCIALRCRTELALSLNKSRGSSETARFLKSDAGKTVQSFLERRESLTQLKALKRQHKAADWMEHLSGTPMFNEDMPRKLC